MVAARVIAHNTTTPFGRGSDTALTGVLQGKSVLTRQNADAWHVSRDFYAGIIEPTDTPKTALSLAVDSISDALGAIPTEDVRQRILTGRTALILSSTKGDLDMPLGDLAESVNRQFGFSLPPMLISNACASGVCALITAWRLLSCNMADYVVVCGVEVQSPFIIAGFQSLFAMSEEPCRPFSLNRTGMNVSEAAATVILSCDNTVCDNAWCIRLGSITNDAYHNNAPSKTAQGAVEALQNVLQWSGIDLRQLACINLHGTATMFNDEMESVALFRSGLSALPAFSLKGYFGHTMGAAGVLETIVSMLAVEQSFVPATLGYDDEPGTSRPINVSSQPQTVNAGANNFLKLISGFGGCNAALLLSNDNTDGCGIALPLEAEMDIVATISLSYDGASLHDLYHSLGMSYPKFFKMDALSQLAFLATEMLLRDDALAEEERFVSRSDRAVILFSHYGCMDTDRRFAETIGSFPSPTLFSYSLPNIPLSEICIRNNYHGEGSMYQSASMDDGWMQSIALATLRTTPGCTSLIFGHIDYVNDHDFHATLVLAKRR